ncbi:MAG TPA: AAA family ATPase, partial [Pirellulales bacterium]|nr:AAA family ATPase [Pirellulales bacterium]
MIKRIRIVNFKSLADVTVDLEPVTVLVGRSGTGKSNFINAVRFLRDFLLLPNDHMTADHGGWARVVCATAPPPQANAPARLLFEVTFDVPGMPGDFQYSLEFAARQKSSQFQLAAESLSLAGNLLFSQRDGKWLHEPSVVPAIPAGSLASSRINGVHEVSLAYLTLTSGIGCYDFSGSVLQNSRAGHPAILSPSQKRRADRGLLDRAENYLQAFA